MFWLRLLLTAATLGAVACYAFGSRDILAGAWAWNWPWLAAAAALAPAVLAGRAWKWRILVRSLDASVSFGQAWKSYLGGLPLGLVTPGRMGEFTRGLFLPQVSLRGAAGAGRVFLDNWTDFLAVLAWALPGWFFLRGLPGLAPGFGLLLVFLPIRFWMRVMRGVAVRLPVLWGLRTGLRKAIPATDALAGGHLFRAGVLGVVLFGAEWLQLDFLLRFLGTSPPGYLALGGLMALVTLANSVQVTLAGLGVREGLAVYLLGHAGVDSRAALLASFSLFFLNLVAPSLAGLLIKPQGWRPVRRL